MQARQVSEKGENPLIECATVIQHEKLAEKQKMIDAPRKVINGAMRVLVLRSNTKF